MAKKAKSQKKAKPFKLEELKKNSRKYPLYLILSGEKKEHGFNLPESLAAFLRARIQEVPDQKYIVADGDANPIPFDPFDLKWMTEQEAKAALAGADHQLRDLREQVDGFRAVDRERKARAIAAGMIPVEVLKGHIASMDYSNDGVQTWTLTLHSFGPSVTEKDPLALAIYALTDHLGVPEDETPPGDPDTADQVVTTLPPIPGE